MTDKQKRKLLLDELKSRINSKVDIGPFDLDGHSRESLKTLIEDIYQRYIETQCVTEYLLGGEGVTRFCGTWIWSEKGKKVTLDSRLNSILGNEAALTEISENRFRTFFDDDDFREIKREIDNPDQLKDNYFQLQHKMKHKENGETWVLTRGSVVYSDGAKDPLIVASVTDINDLKVKEELYVESEARYQALFDTSLDGYLIIDSDSGKIVFANKSAAKFLHLSVAELLTKTMDDLMLSDQAQSEKSISERLSQSKNTELNIVYRKQDGEERFVDINCLNTVVDKKDYLICSLKDVTETQLLVNILKEKQKFLQDIMDNSSALVYLKDLQGKYLMVNRKFSELFGSGIHGKNDYELFSAKYAKLFDEVDKKVQSTGIPVELEEVAPVNGIDNYYLTNKFPLKNAEGEIIGICGISTNVTELKLAKQKIQESHDALRATLRSVPAILIDIDEDGLVNEIWTSDDKKLFLPREKLVNHNIKDYFPQETFDQCMIALNDAKETGFHQGTVITLDIRGNKISYELSVTTKPESNNTKTTFITVAYDVTKELAAKQKLKESEEKLQQYISYAPDGIVIVNEQGSFLEINAAGCQMLGYSEEEIKKMSILDISDPEKLDEAIQAFEVLKKTGRNEVELRLRRKNGSLYWVSLKAVALSEIRFITFCSDISERKLSEQKLKESEKHFRQYISLAPVSIFVVDEEGRYLESNDSANRLLGYTSEELSKMIIPEVVDPEMLDETMQSFEKLQKTGSTEQELRLKHKDGSLIWVSLKAVALSPTRFMSFCSDITERKLSEQRLKESEEKFRQYVLHAPDGIFIADEQGRYFEVNEAGCKMTGYSESEITRMSIPEIVDPSMLEEVLDQFKVLQKVGYLEQEIRLRRKDGSLFWVSLKAVALSPTRYMGFHSDISIRKQAEDALQTARDKLETTLNALPDLLFEVNSEGEILDYRAPHPENLYVNPKTFMGKTFKDVLPEPAASVIMEAFKTASVTGHVEGVTYMLDMPKGQRWFELSVATGGGPNGNLTALIRDITNRKEVEEALRESEEQAHTIIDKSPIGVSICDSSGQCIATNAAMANMIGTTVEEILKQNYNHIDSWKTSGLLDVAKQAVDENTTQQFDMYSESSFGKYVSLNFHISPMPDGRVLFMAVDMSDKEQALKALRESEAKYRLLIETTNDSIAVHWDRKLLFANKSLLELLEVKEKEVLGGNILDFIHPDDKELVIREYGEAPSVSFRLVSSSGKVIYVEVNSSTFDWMGSTAILSAITDVTNLIESQKSELELRVQLTASDRMNTIGQMAAGVAHEVNNPLTVLHGMLEEMVSSIEGISQKDLEGMLRVSTRIRKIIKGLLSFSRQAETDKSKVDISELVDTTLSLVTSLFEKNGVGITVKVLDENVYVNGNQGQLQQVLVNLLFNAMDAMPKGGDITISISRSESNVCLSIEDQGIGIPDDNLKDIFLPFFTTKEIGKGTGLGLSICQGFVADHGGYIDVESKESVGTIFFIYLPRK